MYLVFLDGSGNTGLNLSHPTSTVYLLMALAVHGRAARGLEDAMTAVLERRFGPESRAPRFECKGSDLYRGQGPCAALPPAERVAIYAELMGLLAKHGAELIWVAIDKQRLAARYPHPMHPHKLAFILAEEVERFLRRRREFGLLVSDEEKEVEQQLMEDLSRYKEAGTSFGYRAEDLHHVVDNVHWVKSHNSRLLQLSDCCAYLCQRYHRDRGKTSATARAVQELWEGVAGRVWRGRVWPTG
jgi:hypothetical protein